MKWGEESGEVGRRRGRGAGPRRAVPPVARPAPCRSSEAPPRPASPLPPLAAAARSGCRSRCPRGDGGPASPEPTLARLALSAFRAGGGCGRACGARAAPSPSTSGPRPPPSA